MREITRTRWAAIGAAVAVTLGAGGISLTQAAIDTGDKPVYVALAEPCRLVDTRPAPNNIGPKNTPIAAGEANAYEIQVTGANGNCTGPLAVPAGAVAVATNVTVINPNAPSGRSFFTVYPADAPSLPVTSNLNFVSGQPPTPNKVDVGLSADGKIKIYNADGTANAAVDVFGYYIDHNHDDRYYTETEVDTALAGKADTTDVYTKTEVDSLIGAVSGGGPGGYAHLVVVAKAGGDFTSVTAAMNAIGSVSEYPAPSASARYLVWVAPGVYDNEDVDMQPFVDIQGSGQGVTVLRSVGGASGIGPAAATLVGAGNSELREITVEITAATPSAWTHAIYTAGTTRFHRVTANATGGAHPRGMMIDTGASPVLIDVTARAAGGSDTNTAINLLGSTAVADGVFAEASGGANARGIHADNSSSEIIIENVTTLASQGSAQSFGVYVESSAVTLENLRTVVNTSSAITTGVACTGDGEQIQVLGGVFYAENAQSGGQASGLSATGCDVELRNAVVDAVAPALSTGVQFFQTSTTDPGILTISDVESRAESSGAGAQGLSVVQLGGADVAGRVTDLDVRVSGGSTSQATRGIYHDATGALQYRGVSIILGGTGGFMYGIQVLTGAPRFDQVTIDAAGAAFPTVFGAELFGAGSSVTGAHIEVVNTRTDGGDAVGIKANTGADIDFADIVARAESFANAWGVDTTGATGSWTRVKAGALSSNGVAFGARCLNGAVTISDSILDAVAGGTQSFGLRLQSCDGSATGSQMQAVGPSPAAFGVYATGTGDFRIRDSHIASANTTIRTINDYVLTVVSSSLEGAAATSGSSTDTQQCTAVSYNSGGVDAFQAGTSDPCP